MKDKAASRRNADTRHDEMTAGRRSDVTGALALGSIGAVYATLGGNQAIVFGEELQDPHKKMGR